MAAANELPEKLDKLKITPRLPKVKVLDGNLPVQLNPFFENMLKYSDGECEVQSRTDAPVIKSQCLNSNRTAIQNCNRCRYRHRCSYRTPPSGLLNLLLKKNTSSLDGEGNRKVLLKEPVLKALKTCLHPHSNMQRKLFAFGSDSSTDGILTTKGLSNFRDLIDECRNLLSEDVDFSGKLSLNKRNSRNFTTIQRPKIQNNKSRTNKILPRSTLSMTSLEATLFNTGRYTADVMPLLQPSILGSTLSSTNSQQRNANNLPSEQFSINARCNTSCSQQAGNSVASAACDDVNIDELASYFDTFVHIPKKMSSMAEMMYI